MSKTRTSSFGTGKRESHDSSAFYSRQLYNAVFLEPLSKAEIKLIGNVGREVYRVLRPGRRYVINVANLGRKPYIPIHAFFLGHPHFDWFSADGRNRLAEGQRRQQ